MVTTRQTLEALLMPLAERMLPPLKLGEGLGVAPAIPDPRFDALRNRQGGTLLHPMEIGGAFGFRRAAAWHLDTSLEAIVRAMGAYGLWISYLGLMLSLPPPPEEKWECAMVRGGQDFIFAVTIP